MKKTIYNLALTALVSGIIFTGCNTPAEKVEDAKEEVTEAKQDLNDAQKDANAEAQKVADAEEWRVFKMETEVKIKDNETRIAELKIKLNKPGKVLDPLYAQRIETLEQKNKNLKTKMDNYVPGQSDWASFKREFNHDMDEFGQAFKDLAVDNKK